MGPFGPFRCLKAKKLQYEFCDPGKRTKITLDMDPFTYKMRRLKIRICLVEKFVDHCFSCHLANWFVVLVCQVFYPNW